MSYDPKRDFLALLRSTTGGQRTERMPGTDYLLSALARLGWFTLYVGNTAPATNQANTVWLVPASPSYIQEGQPFLWNPVTLEYEAATFTLWSALLSSALGGTQIQQDVAAAGPVDVVQNAGVVRVMNVGAPVSLVLPLSSAKVGNVLITDWANSAGTHNVTITPSGGDTFPNGLTTLKLAGDGASFFLRPVAGGYAI